MMCLKRTPALHIQHKLLEVLRGWKKEGSISNTRYYRIYPYPTSEEVPTFYGLHKIHKQGVLLRPIVLSIRRITHKLAKFLVPVINPLLGKNKHAIKNSEDFVKKIKDLEVPPPRKLVSYDVTALFTSITVDDTERN